MATIKLALGHHREAMQMIESVISLDNEWGFHKIFDDAHTKFSLTFTFS